MFRIKTVWHKCTMSAGQPEQGWEAGVWGNVAGTGDQSRELCQAQRGSHCLPPLMCESETAGLTAGRRSVVTEAGDRDRTGKADSVLDFGQARERMRVRYLVERCLRHGVVLHISRI